MTRNSVFSALEGILTTLWIGGLWVSGLVFAPVLFSNFERELAGDIAGDLFTAMSKIGIVCGIPLLGLSIYRARQTFWRDWKVGVIVAMLLILLVGEYGVAVQMRELKTLAILGGAPVSGSPEFGRLHALSSSLYLTECLLGLALVVLGRRTPG